MPNNKKRASSKRYIKRSSSESDSDRGMTPPGTPSKMPPRAASASEGRKRHRSPRTPSASRKRVGGDKGRSGSSARGSILLSDENIDRLSQVIIDRVEARITGKYREDTRSRSRTPRARTSFRSSRSHSPLPETRSRSTNYAADYADRSLSRRRASTNREDSVDNSVEQLEIRLLRNKIAEMQGKTKLFREPKRGEEKLIPTFNPANANTTIERWIKRVENVAQSFGWNDAGIMSVIPARLEGNASLCLQVLDVVDWDTTKKQLRQRFSEVKTFEAAMKKAMAYEANPGQSLGDYCFQKSLLLDKTGTKFADAEFIDLVIGGIPDEEIARTIRAARIEDITIFNAHMYSMGSMPHRREDRRYPTDERRKEEGRSNGSEERPESACFNCGNKGHRMKDCRKPKVQCGKCYWYGHQTQNCTSKQRL